MSQHKKLYDQERDTDGYDNLVMKHMLAMTTEGLHSKAAIAVELAFRDHELQKLKAAPDAEPTIWTHFSALAIQNPWTAMFIKPGENPIDKIAMFGEQAGQKYGETRMEAIAELLGESLRMEAATEVKAEPFCYAGYDADRYIKDGAILCTPEHPGHKIFVVIMPMRDSSSPPVGTPEWVDRYVTLPDSAN